jgi:hypothetical protein
MDNFIGIILCGIFVILSFGFLAMVFQMRFGLGRAKSHAHALRQGQNVPYHPNGMDILSRASADMENEIDLRHPLPPGPPFAPMFIPPGPPIAIGPIDDRYSRAPQPLRNWLNPPEFPPRGGITAIPINIPTQGLPEQFGTLGVVEVDGDVWPLYGRRTGSSSDRWNYYTRNNTYNPVPLPIRYQRRDCMDDVGCQELLSGERVRVDVLGKDGKVTIYRADGPKYIPGLF